jgi:hypothetical protein
VNAFERHMRRYHPDSTVARLSREVEGLRADVVAAVDAAGPAREWRPPMANLGDHLFWRCAQIEDLLLEKECPYQTLPYPPDPWELDELLELPICGIPTSTVDLPLYTVKRVGHFGCGLWTVVGRALCGGDRCVVWAVDYLPTGWQRR